MFKKLIAWAIALFLAFCGQLYIESVHGKITSLLFAATLWFVVFYGLFRVILDAIEWVDLENEYSKLKGE